METAIGEAAAGGAIVMFVMSFIKNIGGQWPLQVIKGVAWILAGASTAIVIGGNPELGWSTFETITGVTFFFGAWQIAYATMQTLYKGAFQGSRLETGLSATFVKDVHDDYFEVVSDEE